jgi:hypothetical protein
MAGLLCSAEEREGQGSVGTNESRVCLLVKLFCFRSDKQRPARLVQGGTAIGGPKARFALSILQSRASVC